MEQKLLFKYSLNVKQYSMGQEGFHYWNEIGMNLQGQGAMFDRQPPLTNDGTSVYAEVNKHCVDCRDYKGSSAIKPDFW